MTFTALTLGQWGALFGGVAGVITLLYMLRLRRRRIEVPFGPLWSQVLNDKQTTSLFRVLKRYLSLLFQLVIVALLVTALADPVLDGEGIAFKAPREPEPSHTLLVVDTSASMKATDVPGGRMAAARMAAARVIDAMRPGEQVLVARMDRGLVALTDWTASRDQLLETITRLRAEDTGTAVGPMMQFARNAVRGLQNAQVVWVTDREVAPPDMELARSIHLRVIDVSAAAGVREGARKDNLSVLDFNVRSHLGNRLSYALFYTVKNESRRPVKATVFLYADPDGVARSRADFLRLPPALEPTTLALKPGEERTVETRDVQFAGSRAMLRVSPGSSETGFVDVLAADDVAFAVVPRRKAVKVLMVGPPNMFLQAALMTRANVDVVNVTAADYAGSEGVDLTVWSGASPPRALEPGNHIFVNELGDNLPYVARGRVDGGRLRVPSKRRQHPLMRYVRFVDLEAARLLRFKRRKGDLVMARSQGGKAAILAHSGKEHRWVAVGFDPLASGWVMHYSFSIFFVNSINWFFREEARLLRPWGLAERWDVAVPWKGLDHVMVTTPSGEVREALVDGGGTLAYTATREGIYELRHPDPKTAGQREPVVVAAALKSREESALVAQGDYEAWQAPPKPTAKRLRFDLAGLSLWQALLLAAMGLLLVEWLTYHRRWTV